MDDFETFKANREKMDPSTRKFSKRQWEKAYKAYRSSRERVAESRSKGSEGAPKQRRHSGRTKIAHRSSTSAAVSRLREEVRESSAYGDLRVGCDLLAWIVIGLVVLLAVSKLFLFTNVNAALIAVFEALVLVGFVILIRMLVHVLIDIPDIALHERVKRKDSQSEDTNTED